jgi:hypothetical protein
MEPIVEEVLQRDIEELHERTARMVDVKLNSKNLTMEPVKILKNKNASQTRDQS